MATERCNDCGAPIESMQAFSFINEYGRRRYVCDECAPARTQSEVQHSMGYGVPVPLKQVWDGRNPHEF